VAAIPLQFYGFPPAIIY